MVQIHAGPPSWSPRPACGHGLRTSRPRYPGGVAQLVEHLVCNQAVVGSNPVASTSSSAQHRSAKVRPLFGRNTNNLPPAWWEVFFENKVSRKNVEAPRSTKSVVKLPRVHGGCLGVQSRRRAWHSCEKLRGAAKRALIRRYPRSGNRPGFIPW